MSIHAAASQKTQKGKLIFSKAPPEPPSGVMDRFLAKVAIEALALRLIENSISLNEIIFNQPLDILLRGFARFAYPKEWIYHQRIIYPRLTNQHDQILHELISCIRQTISFTSYWQFLA